MNLTNSLTEIHNYLIDKKFPYHSVSVIYRKQDLRFHVIFMENVQSMITEEVKNKLSMWKVTYSIVKQSK